MPTPMAKFSIHQMSSPVSHGHFEGKSPSQSFSQADEERIKRMTTVQVPEFKQVKKSTEDI